MSTPLGHIHGNGAPRPRPPGVDSDAGQGPAETDTPPDQPALRFEVTGARPIEHAAAPTMAFSIEVEDTHGRDVFMAGLTVQIQIEPAKRRYADEDKAALVELFGEPHRWATTAERLLWTIETVMLPTFSGKTTVEIPVQCNYDLELAAAKYFYSVTDGEIPLAFHFNGSVYYAGEDGRLQVIQISWDTVADYKMPIETWHSLIESYYPYRGWIPVHKDTLAALQRLKAARGAPTFDDAIVGLLPETPIASSTADSSASRPGSAGEGSDRGDAEDTSGRRPNG
jgi:hypothetical protein